MSKFIAVLFILGATCSITLAQESSGNNPPSQGIAPKTLNGIGRADVRVFDENGNPIRNAHVKLESTRTDGFFCESWGDTDAQGVIALPPIHMGSLKLKVKARGYHSEVIEIPTGQLGEPVRVTLKKK